MRKSERKEVPQKEAKKTYTAPRLVEYGKVSKLTQGSAGATGDAGTMRA